MIEEKLWELIRQDIQINDFLKWVYDNSDIETDLGKELYLKLLSSSNIDEVFKVFQDWIYKKFNEKIKLKNYYKVIEVCKKTINEKNNFIQNINYLIQIAPDNYADWNDNDWGELLSILDSAERYPFFIEASLVDKEFVKRMNTFEAEARNDGIQYCENILRRYSDSNIIKTPL